MNVQELAVGCEHFSEEVGKVLTRYVVMMSPPFETGALHETVADWFPDKTETDCGGDGAPIGVTWVDGADQGLQRFFLFSALTSNE